MNSGMYSALSGNIAAMKKLDVLANNLANASTAGFKRDRLRFESMLSVAKGGQPPAAPTDEPVLSAESFSTDHASGPLKQTGNTLDVALEGDGFFVVNTPQGKGYTRQGSFHRTANGRLVTSEGYEVQGNGPITLNGSHIEINDRGEIFVDGNRIAALEIVDFPKPYALQKIGSTMFVPSVPQAVPQPAPAARVNQGFLEESNVSVVAEMVQLIETSRYFEACQRVVRSYDDMSAKAANDLGRL